MYIKNRAPFTPKNVKNFYFKFIDWIYISSFVVEFTSFLNTMEKKNSQTLFFLQELALIYFVLLTEIDKLLLLSHSG